MGLYMPRAAIWLSCMTASMAARTNGSIRSASRKGCEQDCAQAVAAYGPAELAHGVKQQEDCAGRVVLGKSAEEDVGEVAGGCAHA